MRSTPGTFLRFLPLFFGSICFACLVSALLPGQLESLVDPLYSFVANSEIIFAVCLCLIFFLCISLLGLAAYEITKIFSRQRTKFQAPGTASLLMLIVTGCLLFFEVPARLHFYTRIWEIEKALAQKSSTNEPFYFETMHFTRRDSPNECDEQYGFAYLPDRSKARYEITHLHGKWYIFGSCSSVVNEEEI
jgi:hypothetical protein